MDAKLQKLYREALTDPSLWPRYRYEAIKLGQNAFQVLIDLGIVAYPDLCVAAMLHDPNVAAFLAEYLPGQVQPTPIDTQSIAPGYRAIVIWLTEQQLLAYYGHVIDLLEDIEPRVADWCHRIDDFLDQSETGAWLRSEPDAAIGHGARWYVGVIESMPGAYDNPSATILSALFGLYTSYLQLKISPPKNFFQAKYGMGDSLQWMLNPLAGRSLTVDSVVNEVVPQDTLLKLFARVLPEELQGYLQLPYLGFVGPNLGHTITLI